MISGGAYAKQLTFFKNDGKGNFAEGVALKNERGEVFDPGSHANVTTVDWNGDGILDLVYYASIPKVQLRLGKGDLRYGEPQPLPAGGSTLNDLLRVRDARVVFYDWDGDGAEDLIFGNGDGSIRFFKGSRDASGQLSLDGGTLWLESFSPSKLEIIDFDRMEFKNGRPGQRPTITVTDWNGDGKPDLLVGDLFRGPTPQDRIAQNEVYRELRDREFPNLRQTRALLEQKVLAEMGLEGHAEKDLSAEQKETLRQSVAKRLESHPVQLKMNRLSRQLDEYSAITFRNYGYVWVILSR